MKNVIFILLFFVSSTFLSCHKKQDKLEYALEFAGENRFELEKVLLHYSRNPEDSLKYKAACFLIENMPYHYFYESPVIDSMKNVISWTIDKKLNMNDAKNTIQERFGHLLHTDFKIVFDSHVMKSSYLIQNIEQAFLVKEKQSWNKSITFEDFCEYILPYRCAHEPIEEWRGKYFDKFQGLLDSLFIGTDMLKACQLINDSVIVKEGWDFTQWLGNVRLSDLGAVFLLKNRIGNCWDRTFFTTYAMRSVGIPCGIDCFKQNPANSSEHCWNILMDTTGLSCDFEGGVGEPPTRDRFVTAYERKGKIYRRTFSRNKSRLQDVNKKMVIPASLRNELVKDVSNEYFPNEKIVVKCENIPERTNVAYLCVFNNKEWVPIDWAEIKNDSAKFYHMDWRDIVYLVGYFKNGVIIPATDPILTIRDGKYAIPLKPDTSRLHKMIVDRKYPESSLVTFLRDILIGGRFQGSNWHDFRNAVDLYTIPSRPAGSYQTLILDSVFSYRYVRFIAPDNIRADISELEFYDSANSITPLEGTPIGNLPVGGDENHTMMKAFDKDPLTCYISDLTKNAWIGMELKEKTKIAKIRFAPRGDDNAIREGDEYELKYLSKNGWISLGKQVAKTYILTYPNAPNKALFLLSNLTRGREERIFTYENGNQRWW